MAAAECSLPHGGKRIVWEDRGTLAEDCLANGMIVVWLTHLWAKLGFRRHCLARANHLCFHTGLLPQTLACFWSRLRFRRHGLARTRPPLSSEFRPARRRLNHRQRRLGCRRPRARPPLSYTEVLPPGPRHGPARAKHPLLQIVVPPSRPTALWALLGVGYLLLPPSFRVFSRGVTRNRQNAGLMGGGK